MLPEGDGALHLKERAANPSDLIIIKLDVTSDESVELARACVARTMRSDEQLHAIVNNAGVARFFDFEWGTIDDFKQTLDVNLVGIARMVREYLPLLRGSQGRIVNVTSIVARMTGPFNASYSASKHGALGLTDNLREELYKFGIQVINIEPNYVRTNITATDMNKRCIKTAWNNTADSVKKVYGLQCLKNALKFCDMIVNMSFTVYTFY